jgi:hypothetical protein
VKTLLLVLGLFMSLEVLSKQTDWDKFNSSLLIEVTRGDKVFTSTAVAVSPQLLVTAAHALEGNVTKVRVFTQEHYDPKNPALAISSFKLHPGYAPAVSNFRNDIAKIVMKEKLPSSIRIYPIYEHANVQGNLYRFGFGARNNNNNRTVITPTFKKINLPDQVVELNDKFSRSGDSGGPIFLETSQGMTILAIHSTLSKGPNGDYSFNPLLSVYLPWIYEN